MKKNNVQHSYQLGNFSRNENMQSKTEISSMESKSLSISEFRLLSINKVSKLLSIRYESVRKLVRFGRIKAVLTVNNKYKIPYINLIEFVRSGCDVNNVTESAISIEDIQNRIDNLIKEYSK